MTDDSLKAGRALDELVAQKVMGLVPCDQWTPFNFGSAGGPALQKNCAHDHCYPTVQLDSVMGPVGGCPRYSSDIRAVYQVEERIKDLGLSERYAYELVHVVIPGSAFGFLNRGAYEDDIYAMVHASPEHRCIAALKVMEATASVSH
jgi:hypothetical protein